jgi:hypothetical protein
LIEALQSRVETLKGENDALKGQLASADARLTWPTPSAPRRSKPLAISPNASTPWRPNQLRGAGRGGGGWRAEGLACSPHSSIYAVRKRFALRCERDPPPGESGTARQAWSGSVRRREVRLGRDRLSAAVPTQLLPEVRISLPGRPGADLLPRQAQLNYVIH